MKSMKSAPKYVKTIPYMDSNWEKIRDLRNRVFHHERVIHWTDLKEQHQTILEMISYLSPGLKEMAEIFDRFPEIYSKGLEPWLEQVHHHWPQEEVEAEHINENQESESGQGKQNQQDGEG